MYGDEISRCLAGGCLCSLRTGTSAGVGNFSFETRALTLNTSKYDHVTTFLQDAIECIGYYSLSQNNLLDLPRRLLTWFPLLRDQPQLPLERVEADIIAHGYTRRSL
jgi:hypothetical protein